MPLLSAGRRLGRRAAVCAPAQSPLAPRRRERLIREERTGMDQARLCRGSGLSWPRHSTGPRALRAGI
eukprot:6026572-Prymnesium_polylepis.1